MVSEYIFTSYLLFTSSHGNQVIMMLTMKSVFIFFLTAFLLIGCEDRALTDPNTQIEIPTVKSESGNLVMRVRNDGMIGHGDYTREELVIDLGYYKNHTVERGDVVHIKNPDYGPEQSPDLKIEETGMLRVIALPGETIRIQSGQVYINGKMLDTFYGKPPGPGLEELKKMEKAPNDFHDIEIQNLRYHIHNYENDNLDSVRVPKGSFFLLADNRWRVTDSKVYGAVSAMNILGKVMGYLDKHVWEVSPSFSIPFPSASDGKAELLLRGEKGKLAIVDQPIFAGKPYQNYWFFWGKPEVLSGSPEIIAVRQNHAENRRVVFAAGGVSGPLAGADGHIPPSNMTIPEPGLWRLEAYIAGTYFGSLVVEVK
jgi:signal peptidase I